MTYGTSGALTVQLLGNGGEVVQYTVADGTTIYKGDVLVMPDSTSDPMTAVASTSSHTGKCFAGIASTEKVASDGSTSLGLYTYGIFDMVAVQALGIGSLVCISGANVIRAAVAADILSGAIIGKLLETATQNERVKVLVGVGV